MKSFILGESDGPNELISLACTFMAEKHRIKVDGSTSKLTATPWRQQTSEGDN